MIDEPTRAWIARWGAAPAHWLTRVGVTPNQITTAALLLGLGAAVAIAQGYPRVGIACWLVSRLLDAYDGLVARAQGSSSAFGGYFDISADMLTYSAMAVAFAWADPAHTTLWMLVLVGYVMAISTTLALSSLLERLDRQLGGNRSLQFTTALAEGGETTIVYVLVALWPTGTRMVLFVWLVLLAMTAIQRSVTAFRVLR